MKVILVLGLLACVLAVCTGTPLEKARAKGIQSRQEVAPAAPAAPVEVADEDDDDDDDDDEGLDVLGDDDDDDDDEDDEEESESGGAGGGDDEDDDDGDYLERFFEDFLGDDDDDDDEDTVAAAASTVAPTPAAQITPPPQPALVADAVDQSADLPLDEPVDAVEVAAAAAPVAQNEIQVNDDDDDDDDDDEFIGEEFIEARSLNRQSKQLQSTPSETIARYNNVVDHIFGRINGILKRSYDPVNIRLTSKAKKAPSTKKTKGKKKSQKKSRSVDTTESEKVVPLQPVTEVKPVVPEQKQEDTELRATSKKTASAKVTNKKRKTAKPKNESDPNKTTRARGAMFGLASLKRQGDVRVTAEDNIDTVKSNFILGPLTLKVSKSFARGAKRELRSATATTTEMRGRITLRIVDGIATLRSIKVQQPKQVQIETPSNKNNRTRDLIWKKSYNIAHVVADKLTAATKTMLEPQTFEDGEK